jgi:DNA-binding NarL/FixJ family response regulator
VVKSASTQELIAAIRTVADCGHWFPPGIAAMARRTEGSRETLATRLNSLTPQQYRVLELVAQGKLNKQIAAELSIEETTVKAHVSAALAKLGVRNRTQASIVFRELEI